MHDRLYSKQINNENFIPGNKHSHTWVIAPVKENECDLGETKFCNEPK